MFGRIISFNGKLIIPIFAALCLICGVRSALADTDGAKKDIQTAQKNLDDNDLKSASDNLDLATAELDGVDDATKADLTKQIGDLKQKVTNLQNAAAKDDIQKQIDSKMDTAKQSLDSGFDDADKDIQDFLSQDATKTALGNDAIQKYLKTLSVYRKVAKARAAQKSLDQTKGLLDQAEKDWPDKKTAMQNTADSGAQQQASDDFSRELDQIETNVKDYPDDQPELKAQKDRFAKLSAEYKVVYYQGKAADTYSRLKDNWDSYSDEYKGWDQEAAGASFDDLLHRQSDDMSKLNAPKSVGLVTRANYCLGIWLAQEDVQILENADPKLKGFFDGLRHDRKAALDKLAGFASTILDQAEKATLDKDGRDRLEEFAEDDLRIALDGSDQQKKLQDRAMTLVRAFDAKTIGDDAARQKLYDALVDQGGKAWDGLAGKIDTAGDMDANAIIKDPNSFTGKVYRFKGVKNRMGWDYSPGNGYAFALTIDGTAVAAKYDSTIQSAVKETERRTAKDFSDEEYDVIAKVDDVGPIVRIARAEGTISNDSGDKLNVTSTADETVQGVRMTVIALHVGPVTATADGGEVDENGNLKQPAQ